MRSRVLGLVVVLGVAVGVFGAISPAGAASKPGAPGRPTAVAGNKSARVSWPAPTNGGSPITIYLVTPYVGSKAQKTRTFHSKATSEVVSGLANGKTYTFRVAAHNAVGTGKQSAASKPVTLGMPGAPSHLTAAPGNAQATVTWSAPNNGGSAIVSYTVTPYLGSKAQAAETFHSAATSEVVTGLTNLKSYSFRVSARNGAGTGPMSDAVGTVEPTSAPTLSMVHSTALNEDILVDAYGNAVYMYAPDGAGTISTAGAELYIWPSVDWSGTPTLGAGLTGGAVVDVQHDGTQQLSYNGHLLYTFAYDPPGGATGDGTASFYLLSPAGAEI